jgi:hypothetical protein
MNAFDTRKSLKRRVKPLVVALSFALPGSAALAASIDDVVRTRSDQNIDQHYGRDSVYAFSPEAKPLKPEQTGSRDTNVLGTMKTYAGDAWQKTESFAAGLWDKTTGMFHGHEAGGSVVQSEPQPYGRAGGFVGADRIAVLDSSTPNMANATPTSYPPAGTPRVMKTGTAENAASGSRKMNSSQAADGLGGPSGDNSARGQENDSMQAR